MAIKLGLIGDSNTDAYRGTDNRGGSYSAVTFNWAELLVMLRGVDLGSWGAYSEPRRTDYARNWARSAARSDTLLTQGQHTGLAAQLDGSTYAICWIGTNDIRPDDLVYRYSWGTIYNDASNPASFYADPIVADVFEAVDALAAEDPAAVLVCDYADFTTDPAVIAAWPDATKRGRLTAVFARINSLIHAGVATRGLTPVPYAAWGRALQSQVTAESGEDFDHWTHWGVRIENDLGDEPHNQQLADNHFGTVMNWRFAALIVEALRAAGADIAPVRPYEVFDLVGFAGRPKGSMRRTG